MDSTIQGNIGSEMDELQWNTVQCLLVWLARMDEVVISEKAVIVAEGRVPPIDCDPIPLDYHLYLYFYFY